MESKKMFLMGTCILVCVVSMAPFSGVMLGFDRCSAVCSYIRVLFYISIQDIIKKECHYLTRHRDSASLIS
jgi:hypothetical protein